MRIYRKGLEAQKKFGWPSIPRALIDVIRVELQIRKSQLEERHRESVAALRTARVKPEPNEHTIPEIKIKSNGRKIGRRHLHCIRRGWHPRRAIEATEAVGCFLVEQGLDLLVPGHFGVELPDPRYGESRVYA